MLSKPHGSAYDGTYAAFPGVLNNIGSRSFASSPSFPRVDKHGQIKRVQTPVDGRRIIKPTAAHSEPH